MTGSQFRQYFWIKIFGAFSLVRGGNILVLALTQYLIAYYIIAPNVGLRAVLFDSKLFCLVLASSLIASAGYIINNFFDAAKDQINRPKQFLLRHLLSQQEQLTLFFLLNLLAVIVAAAVSFKAVLFFGVYSLAIYGYSVFLKRLYWISNWAAAFLILLPFYVIAQYYNNQDPLLYRFATYLYLLLLSRDLIKDLENFRGDFAQRYQTLPIVFGQRATKVIISVVLLLEMLPLYFLMQQPLGKLQYYFYLSYPSLLLLLIFLWVVSTQKAYLWLHNVIKGIIFLGVLSIYWINK